MLTMKGWFGVGKKQLGDYVRNMQERIRTLTMHNLLNSTHYLSCQTCSFLWIPYFSKMSKSPRAIITNPRKVGGLKEQKFILSQFRMPGAHNQGLVPSGCPPCLSPSFWWLTAILGISWLVDMSSQSLVLSSDSLLLSVSVCPECLLSGLSHWI